MPRVIAITGGSTGIGAATVARLCAAGHAVHVLDVAPPDRDDVRFVPCDLGDPATIDAALAQLPAALDVLVQVAGVAVAEPAVRTLAINFLGMRHLTEAALPRIASGGDIVLVASSAGWDWRRREALVRSVLATEDFASGYDLLLAHEAEWQANPYKFSKQCAAAYTYVATGRALPHGVRVNCVSPGSTATRLTPEFRDLVGHELYDWGVAQLDRHGTPDDVAEVITFFAEGSCRWINGVDVLADGGYLAGIHGGWIRPQDAPAATQVSPPGAMS